jgi:hypothetical protein
MDAVIAAIKSKFPLVQVHTELHSLTLTRPLLDNHTSVLSEYQELRQFLADRRDVHVQAAYLDLACTPPSISVAALLGPPSCGRKRKEPETTKEDDDRKERRQKLVHDYSLELVADMPHMTFTQAKQCTSLSLSLGEIQGHDSPADVKVSWDGDKRMFTVEGYHCIPLEQLVAWNADHHCTFTVDVTTKSLLARQ